MKKATKKNVDAKPRQDRRTVKSVNTRLATRTGNSNWTGTMALDQVKGH